MEFKQLKKYAELNRKWDAEKFKDAKEVCKMLDFLNQEREQKLEKELGEEAKSISKWFVNNLGKSYFFINAKAPEPDKLTLPKK